MCLCVRACACACACACVGAGNGHISSIKLKTATAGCAIGDLITAREDHGVGEGFAARVEAVSSGAITSVKILSSGRGYASVLHTHTHTHMYACMHNCIHCSYMRHTYINTHTGTSSCGLEQFVHVRQYGVDQRHRLQRQLLRPGVCVCVCVCVCVRACVCVCVCVHLLT